MIFKAVISSKAHPEYGQATIPFPIPDSEYDRTIDLLESMGIGSPTVQDCRVDEVDSRYPILNRLTAQSVNVDELDYLAKRLDSFDDGEDVQFEAMASKLCLSDIKDFINLTFSCQQATVITDFSKLEQVGKSHSLHVHGGSMPTEEFDKLDGHAIALDLIQSGTGVVTPYGVVYDNGMELEQFYTGLDFPPYCYEPAVLALEVTTESAMGSFYLPMPDCQLERMLIRGGIENHDLPLNVAMDGLPCKVSDMLGLEQLTVDELSNLNRLCHAIQPMDKADVEKLNAVVLMAQPEDAQEVCQLAENLDQFDFIPGVEEPERNSQINDLGYVVYRGSLTLDKLMQCGSAELSRQGQQMGGMG